MAVVCTGVVLVLTVLVAVGGDSSGAGLIASNRELLWQSSTWDSSGNVTGV